MRIQVRIIKPAKDKIVTYEADVVQRTDTYILVHARWNAPFVDMDYFTFEPDDHLYEHFYSDRWYNVYEVNTQAGTLKGWYCNITRPAVFSATSLDSEDLEIDLFVSPDRRTILVLDEEEYAARGLALSEPQSHEAVQAAIVELHALAKEGAAPFICYYEQYQND